MNMKLKRYRLDTREHCLNCGVFNSIDVVYRFPDMRQFPLFYECRYCHNWCSTNFLDGVILGLTAIAREPKRTRLRWVIE